VRRWRGVGIVRASNSGASPGTSSEVVMRCDNAHRLLAIYCGWIRFTSYWSRRGNFGLEIKIQMMLQ
jgi:hypothetical protein